MVKRILKGAVLVTSTFGIPWAVGCGDAAISQTTVATAQEAFDRGSAELEVGQFEAARASFDSALTHGGLNADVYVEALLNRSIALSAIGQYDGAEVDIDLAEQGATDIDQVHLARAFLFQRKGDQAAADRELAEARRINPKAKLPLQK
jgi:tetratricopeptide (TPR) repeat protein